MGNTIPQGHSGQTIIQEGSYHVTEGLKVWNGTVFVDVATVQDLSGIASGIGEAIPTTDPAIPSLENINRFNLNGEGVYINFLSAPDTPIELTSAQVPPIAKKAWQAYRTESTGFWILQEVPVDLSGFVADSDIESSAINITPYLKNGFRITSSGIQQGNPAYKMVENVPISSNTSYTISGFQQAGNKTLAWYTSGNVFISFAIINTGYPAASTVVSPSNASFVSWNNVDAAGQIDSSGTLALNKGTSTEVIITGIKGGKIEAKTLSSDNIVPSPVIDSNATNKGYVDNAIGNKVTGANSDMTGANSWAIGTGTPTLSINGTVANKMLVTWSGTAANNSVILPNTLVIGKYYRVSFKSALHSGTSSVIRVGNFTTSSGAFKIDIRPGAAETEFSFVIKALTTSLSIGVLAANNNGSAYTFDDIKAYELSDSDVATLDLGDVKTFGCLGNGVIDDLPPFQSMLNYQSENAIANRRILFKDGIFRITDLCNIAGFANLDLQFDNANLKSDIQNVSNRHGLSINSGGSVRITGLKYDLNNDPKMLQAVRLYLLTGTVTLIDCEVYNFNNINQRGVYMEEVTRNPSLGIANYLPSPLIMGCKFYNKQVVDIPSYNYTTSTFKGCGIELATNAEYVQIIGCNFYGISQAIKSAAGANSTITTNIFEQCDPTQVSAATGVITMDDTAGNNGKLIISNNKFNHLFGRAIVFNYTIADRGSHITNNQFIVNSWTAITLNACHRNQIHGNIFMRLNEQSGLTGFPFTPGDAVGIEINNSFSNSIKDNDFNTGMAHAVTSTGTADRNVVADNTYDMTALVFTDMVGSNNVLRNNDFIS